VPVFVGKAEKSY